MSKLLIDDNPLQVLPKLAEAIGLNEAIVIQQIHYWLNKSENVHDGKKWVYNTYDEWKKDNFPFWSAKVIGNIFRSLESKGVVISKQINSKDWDRRKWYTINYEELKKIEDEIFGTFDDTHLGHSIEPNLDSLHITETTSETTTTTPVKNIFQLYEENIGAITPILSDTLWDAEKDYPASWIEDAIGLAVEANVRKWNYVEAILKRWKVTGKDDGKQKQPKRTKKQSDLDALKERHQAELRKEAANVV